MENPEFQELTACVRKRKFILLTMHTVNPTDVIEQDRSFIIKKKHVDYVFDRGGEYTVVRSQTGEFHVKESVFDIVEMLND